MYVRMSLFQTLTFGVSYSVQGQSSTILKLERWSQTSWFLYIEVCIPQRGFCVKLTLISRISYSVIKSSTNWVGWCSSYLNSGGSDFKISVDTGYIGWCLLWFSSIHPGKSQDSTSVRSLLPSKYFQFIIHQSTYHSTLLSLSYWHHSKMNHKKERKTTKADNIKI
jgi:hypothetical protein